MDLTIPITIIYNIKHFDATRLKSRDKLLTFPDQLVLEGKASICSTIKENIFLFCYKFSVIFVVIII